MYTHILVPVDLANTPALDKAMATAADLAAHYAARVTLLGITASGPTFAAATPQHYQRRLALYAAEQGRKLGATFETRAIIDPDPRADLHRELLRQVNEVGADLVVMASHVPGFVDYLFSSNAGHLAAHAAVSVFVVR